MTNQLANRPNIIICLVDDLGFSDLGSYGSRLLTRNIDALAENGIRCTQMYNSARCCPSRAALLTGLYPHQAGVGHMTADYGIDSYQGLSERQVRYYRRSAAYGRLSYAYVRQVARRRQLPPARARIRLAHRRGRLPNAEAARVRSLLWHLGRLHFVLQPRLARTGRHAD